jgi:hypothetical protein
MVPVSRHLPAQGNRAGSLAWIGRSRTTKRCPSRTDQAHDRGKPRRKTAITLRPHPDKARRHVPRANFTLPASSSAIVFHQKLRSQNLHE